MDQQIFKEWFKKKYILQVREHLKSQNLPQKAVLLINNVPSHLGVLKSINGNCFVKFLPPTITVLIQPMDLDVTASMKKNYRTSLHRKEKLKRALIFESFGKIIRFLMAFMT